MHHFYALILYVKDSQRHVVFPTIDLEQATERGVHVPKIFLAMLPKYTLGFRKCTFERRNDDTTEITPGWPASRTHPTTAGGSGCSESP